MVSRVYVALGDSTGVGIGASGGGYVDRLFHELRAASRVRCAWRLTNLAASGATSATVRERQVGEAVRHRPDLVTLFVGGNDVWRGGEAASYRENLEVIARALERTSARVVAGDMVDLSRAPAAEFAERALGIPRRAIADACAALGTAVHEIGRAHGWSVVRLSAVPMQDEHFSADGFHPSDAGYEALARAFWPAVERAVAGG